MSYQQTQRQQQRTRQLPNFIVNPDNPGTARWRLQEPPNSTIDIANYVQLPEGEQPSDLKEISRQTGTYIEIGSGGTTKRQFRIWGSQKSQVDAAIMRLDDVVNEYRAAAKSKTQRYVKTAPTVSGLKKDVERKIEAEDRRQAYRREPLPDATFEAIGFFVWPEKEHRPEDVLGTSYEALDPVRMETGCHIVYDKTRVSFKIMGRMTNVRNAIDRIRTTCFQVAARTVLPTPKYFLHWSDPNNVASTVRLVTSPGPRLLKATTQARSTVTLPCGEGRLPAEELEARLPFLDRQISINAKRVKDCIMATIRKIKFYRGNLQMRARLGSFALLSYRPPRNGIYVLTEFESMLFESQFSARVTEELGSPILENGLLARIQEAEELFSPQGVFTRRLVDVKPIYTAILTIENDAGDIQLSKSWQDNDGHFDTMSSKWCRLDRGCDTANSLVDVSITDLRDGLAWQFEMLATQCIEESRLPETIQDFANYYLDIDAKEARNFVTMNRWIICKRHVANKKSLQQRVAWHFDLKNTDYTVEVSKVQNMTYEASPPGLSFATDQKTKVAYEPRWTVSVMHRQWDSNFSDNSCLEIGKGATWMPDLQTWFPLDSFVGKAGLTLPIEKGVEQLLEKLLMIQEVVRGGRAGQYRGMTVD